MKRPFLLFAVLLFGFTWIHAQSVAPDASKYKLSVDPLLKSNWSQGVPFNEDCPTQPSGMFKIPQHCPVGCVALALGQIMYYYQYPEVGQGSFKRKTLFDTDTLSADFGETHYDWVNMLDTYTSAKSDYTSSQIDAVATLLYQCGIAVGMIYQLSGSSAFSYSNIPSDLVKYFRYSSDNIRYLNRSKYSKEEWMDLIYNELSNGRPIFYSGNSPSQGGHAWVLDGYDASGKVHINWGWRGLDNGYYDIDLDNDTLDFKNEQAMVIGIQPPADVTGIAHAPAVSDDCSEIQSIYSIDGIRLSKMQKGMNIIRYANGKVKKFFIR